MFLIGYFFCAFVPYLIMLSSSLEACVLIVYRVNCIICCVSANVPFCVDLTVSIDFHGTVLPIGPDLMFIWSLIMFFHFVLKFYLFTWMSKLMAKH